MYAMLCAWRHHYIPLWVLHHRLYMPFACKVVIIGATRHLMRPLIAID